MPEVHVVPSGDRWACEIGETGRSTHDTRAAAIKRGCLVAHQRACELVIHAHDGTFREEGRPGIDFRGIPG
jgi:Uncharacterized protein conserved in bacteria (DUF2188)